MEIAALSMQMQMSPVCHGFDTVTLRHATGMGLKWNSVAEVIFKLKEPKRKFTQHGVDGGGVGDNVANSNELIRIK